MSFVPPLRFARQMRRHNGHGGLNFEAGSAEWRVALVEITRFAQWLSERVHSDALIAALGQLHPSNFANAVVLPHDTRSNRLALLVLGRAELSEPRRGIVARLFDPIADWRAVANDVRGRALPAGHYLPEEVPEQTVSELMAFFAT